MNKVYIISGMRTPLGIYDGKLQAFTEQQLLSLLIKAMIEKDKVDPSLLDEIIIGCGKQTSTPSNIARHAALMAEIPYEVPAYTVQCQSASGLQAVAKGYWQIKSEASEMVLVGGVESMTNIPREIHDARYHFDRQTKVVYEPISAQLVGAQPEESYGALSNVAVAETIAENYGISQAEILSYAAGSHIKAKLRQSANHIIPVEVKKKKAVEIVNCDEIYEHADWIAKPADGAGLCLLAKEETATRLNLPVLGSIQAIGISAGDPSGAGWIGTEAVKKALAKANLLMAQIGLIAYNEIFAASALAMKEELVKLGATNIDEIFNRDGGSLSTGNAWGAMGTILLIDLLHQMKEENIPYGLAIAPAEGGQVVACIVKSE